ncbi:MAG: HAMP domain-containing protein [Bacteroidales bacterium]
MRKRIKTKILVGFLIVIGMLATAGGVSIYEFVRISGLVQSLIKDNYKTIQAGRSMIEALERKDSGVLLLLLGQFSQGSALLQEADTNFKEALTIAAGNITEPGENELIETIRLSYEQYDASTDKADDMEPSENLKWYQDVVHQEFYRTKSLVSDLITLNQDAMFQESTQLEQQSKRALMPGIVSICVSLVFLLLLNFFISRYFVRPIVQLKTQIQRYKENPKGVLITDVDSEDEIRDLADAVEKLVEKLNQ